MNDCRQYFWTLLACLMLGCGHNTPTSRPDNANNSDELVSQLADLAREEFKTVQEDLDQREVVLIVDGVRDEEHAEELFLKVQGLKDTGAQSSTASNQGGCYHAGDRTYRVSPISDVEAAADRVDFGRVQAVDSAARIIVVDAAADSVSRPETGWPGAPFIDQYAIRHTVNFAAERAEENPLRKFGRDRVVVVWMPSTKVASGTSGNPSEIVEKLRVIAPGTTISDWPMYGPRQVNFTRISVAPIEDLSMVRKALEGELILAVDEDQNVVLLGPLEALKP